MCMYVFSKAARLLMVVGGRTERTEAGLLHLSKLSEFSSEIWASFKIIAEITLSHGIYIIFIYLYVSS